MNAIHVIGWLVLTVALTAAAYFAGTKQLHRNIRRRVIVNGKTVRIRKGRIVETDAVSAYPPELTEKIRHSSEYGKTRTRDDLLRDPLSGAKPLHPER